MNEEALLRLADKLEGKGPYEKNGPIPKERFDISKWVDDPYTIKLKDIKERVVKPNLPCGTVACAVGWAGSDPWFRRHGLYTVFGGISYMKPGFVGTSSESIQAFFQITEQAANYLFIPTLEERRTYKTPK